MRCDAAMQRGSQAPVQCVLCALQPVEDSQGEVLSGKISGPMANAGAHVFNGKMLQILVEDNDFKFRFVKKF